jgi:hypothetical protein
VEEFCGGLADHPARDPDLFLWVKMKYQRRLLIFLSPSQNPAANNPGTKRSAWLKDLRPAS